MRSWVASSSWKLRHELSQSEWYYIGLGRCHQCSWKVDETEISSRAKPLPPVSVRTSAFVSHSLLTKLICRGRDVTGVFFNDYWVKWGHELEVHVENSDISPASLMILDRSWMMSSVSECSWKVDITVTNSNDSEAELQPAINSNFRTSSSTKSY